MGQLIYSMSVSLDGYICDPNGKLDWSVPSEAVHRAHNVRCAGLHAQLVGRGLYEVMVPWETQDIAGDDPVQQEFAAIWAALPKVVFSHTLTAVEGNARLATGELADEIKALTAHGDVAIGGAGLAAQAIDLDLVDEYCPFVVPIILGGGTPFLPPLTRRLNLELTGHRTFENGVVALQYRRSARTTCASAKH